ncbi:MAG: hypothetical protein Rsou_2049 [Candidatus Ruthia sp. Asou_11_S2]|nr:hypothetical protein [Candidatus Ruthia sp. Asou_11_S2]
MDIKYSKQAIKYLVKIDDSKKGLVVSKIKQLPLGDVKKFINHPKATHRLRVGGIRVLFRIEQSRVIIAKIGNRGDFYK